MPFARPTSSDLLARATVGVLFTFLSINVLRDFMQHGPRSPACSCW